MTSTKIDFVGSNQSYFRISVLRVQVQSKTMRFVQSQRMISVVSQSNPSSGCRALLELSNEVHKSFQWNLVDCAIMLVDSKEFLIESVMSNPNSVYAHDFHPQCTKHASQLVILSFLNLYSVHFLLLIILTSCRFHLLTHLSTLSISQQNLSTFHSLTHSLTSHLRSFFHSHFITLPHSTSVHHIDQISTFSSKNQSSCHFIQPSNRVHTFSRSFPFNSTNCMRLITISCWNSRINQVLKLINIWITFCAC
mmetsp:Transcript_951/g.1776  ORF Transcript_951/g.1776 Transcript_951/m.1776 type:complete len:251 (+) Transcript_951:840-1592(+)